jgi:putative transposase
MDDDKRYPRPKSARLPNYDYSLPGAYFITICTHNRAPIFGHIENGESKLNRLGRIVEATWLDVPKHQPHIVLFEQVVMPNHFHAVLVLRESDSMLTPSPHDEIISRLAPGSLSVIVRSFKAAVTKKAHEIHLSSDKIWQPNYWERVIRDEHELAAVRQYVINNALRWESDRENSIKAI